MYQHDGVKGSHFQHARRTIAIISVLKLQGNLLWKDQAFCTRALLAYWTQKPVLELAWSQVSIKITLWKVCVRHKMSQGLFRTRIHWYISFWLLCIAFPFPCPRSNDHKWPSSPDLCSPSTSALPVVQFQTQAPWTYSDCSLDLS